MLRSVDSSLLDEWQSLRGGDGRVVPLSSRREPGPPPSLAEDARALGVRVRGELHRLLQAIAGKRWDDALAAIKPTGWTAESLAAELAPYFAEHASIDVTPRARRPSQTVIQPADEPGTFTARQRLLDPAGDEDWMIDAFVDARAPAGDEPMVELRGVRR